MEAAKTKILPQRGSPLPESAFRELLRTIGLLERIMASYFARFGISGAQWGVLRNLHRAEQDGVPGLRLTDLSDRLLVRPPSVTGIVDRLERAGLVQRGEAPTDLRAKHVALTPRGRELVEHVLAYHGGQIEKILGGLNGPEQEEFHRLLKQLSHYLEELLVQQAADTAG